MKTTIEVNAEQLLALAAILNVPTGKLRNLAIPYGASAAVTQEVMRTALYNTDLRLLGEDISDIVKQRVVVRGLGFKDS